MHQHGTGDHVRCRSSNFESHERQCLSTRDLKILNLFFGGKRCSEGDPEFDLPPSPTRFGFLPTRGQRSSSLRSPEREVYTTGQVGPRRTPPYKEERAPPRGPR